MLVKRFGVSLEESILKDLDELVSLHQFPNRSQAIRHLIKESAVKSAATGNNLVAGVLVLVYDHHKRDLSNQLTDIQHEHHDLTISTQHIHLSHNLCLETITLKGKARSLTSLADKIIALKGIHYGKLVIAELNDTKGKPHTHIK